MALEGDKDGGGRLLRARLSDGDVLDIDVAVLTEGGWGGGCGCGGPWG